MSDEGKLKKRLITEAGRYAVHGKTSDVVVKWEHIEKVLAEKAKNFPDPGELRFKRALNTPHQYHPSTIIKCLLEISKGEKRRDTMARQLSNMLEPSILRKTGSAVLDHLFRETY